jgi:hypothetical protein
LSRALPPPKGEFIVNLNEKVRDYLIVTTLTNKAC